MPIGGDQVVQIAYKMPQHIQLGLLNGDFIQYGQIIRSAATGKYVAQLKPTQLVDQAAQNGLKVGLQLAESKSGEAVRVVAGAAKAHSVAAVATATVAIAGVAGAAGYGYMKKNRKPKNTKLKALPVSAEQQAVAHEVTNAAASWVAAAEKGEMTNQIIADLENVLAQYHEQAGKEGGAAVAQTAQNFTRIVADHTSKIAEANEVVLELPAPPTNVVDLGPFLQVQRQVFARRDKNVENG
jgi:hypothetical protein